MSELQPTQNAVESHVDHELAPRNLSPQQVAAIDLLVGGKTVSESARTLGISRTTIHRWLKTNRDFKAFHLQCQNLMVQSIRAHLLSLAIPATDAIEKSLDAGDANTALRVLKGLGILSPNDPENLED